MPGKNNIWKFLKIKIIKEEKEAEKELKIKKGRTEIRNENRP